MLILSSSNPKGKASIMTANLDGETNLTSSKNPPPLILQLRRGIRKIVMSEGSFPLGELMIYGSLI